MKRSPRPQIIEVVHNAASRMRIVGKHNRCSCGHGFSRIGLLAFRLLRREGRVSATSGGGERDLRNQREKTGPTYKQQFSRDTNVLSTWKWHQVLTLFDMINLAVKSPLTFSPIRRRSKEGSGCLSRALLHKIPLTRSHLSYSPLTDGNARTSTEP